MPDASFCAIGSADCEKLFTAIEPFWDEVTQYVGNLDDQYLQWMGVVVKLPKETARLMSRAFREDMKFATELYDNEDDALEAVYRLTHFRD